MGVAPTGAAADIYRYVDRNGVEHYTNVPSRGRRYQLVVRGSRSSRRLGGRGKRRRAPDPGRLTRYDAHIREAARLYSLPAPFIRAVMRVESNFYRDAVSHKGAMGLMQLMPATATAMGVVDPFEPRQNVLGGARFLRVLANQFQGDLVLTIAAYNAGHGAVRKYGGVPPYRETRRYVRRVLEHYYKYRAAPDDAHTTSRSSGPG
ncbi:MAG: lytic transglycosylase domain-containing protein [Myxococcales bacterium]|nr:lytic transglycosylase domain-containing protein [Myxococcales bacterium]